MNSKITETRIRRMLDAHEERIRRIIENEQEERKRCYNLSFKLVGMLNMFDMIPGFVVPIFICLQDEPEEPNEMNKPLYFQVVDNEKDTLICFSKLENYGEHCRQRVKRFTEKNNYAKMEWDIYSKPLYAFHFLQDEVQYGYYSEMKEFLTEYQTEDEILKGEIQDFLDLESENIWQRLRIQLEINFPYASKDAIEMRIKSLRNNDFEGKKLELYVPKFQNMILRVGVRVKGEKKKAYFSTAAGKFLENLLLDP